MVTKLGDKYYIELTRKKRIFTRPATRIWYLDSYGVEQYDYIIFKKIIREEGKPDRIVGTVSNITPDYVELLLENHRILSVHHEFLDTLERKV